MKEEIKHCYKCYSEINTDGCINSNCPCHQSEVKMHDLDAEALRQSYKEAQESYGKGYDTGLERGKEIERERIADTIKINFNGFGGVRGFTESDLLSLLQADPISSLEKE